MLTYFILASLLAHLVGSLVLNPCTEPTPVERGKGFVVGLAWWPGGTPADWGNATNSSAVHPCNPAVKDKLAAAGVQWGVYNSKVDQLMVLKTSYLETRYMMNKTLDGKPPVMTVVAFRGAVRSEPRYVMSLDSNTTRGVGFVVSLALLAKFDKGNLKYLSWYDLKCNDCGGYSSSVCINKQSCALAPSNCTCEAVTTISNSTSSNSTTNSTSCDLNGKQFAGCATSINLAFEGVDKNYQAFQTAAQVRKLNQYSLVSLYGVGKSTFLNTKDMLSSKFTVGYNNFINDLSSSQTTFANQFSQSTPTAPRTTGT